MKTYIVFLFHFLAITVDSSNFLVYCPLFAHSHHKFLAKIADTLTLAGHNVTFLAPIIAQKYEKVKYLEHTKDLIYIQPDDELQKLGDLMDTDEFSRFWTEDPSVFSMIPTMQLFQKMFFKVYENLKNDLSVLDSLRSRKFDAMIYEVLAFNAIAIQDYLEIKTLYPSFSITHNLFLSKSIGEPASPSILSSPVSPFGDRMTFRERLLNTICDYTYRNFLSPPKMHSYKHPNSEINLEDAVSRSSFAFLNSNPYLDFPRPTITKTVLIGGISVNMTEIKQEVLNEEYENILKKRNKNVLISFGSVMFSKDMPVNYKDTIVDVIKSFPNVTFIWKYECDNVEFSGNLENLHFSKWVPQTALLVNSRLSAFITHAGLGSVNELSYIGKPAILIPIFADQLRNAKMLERHNGSISLNKKHLGNFKILRETLKLILFDESYKSNAENLARKLERQPISPQDLLVKHAEFGAEFGELVSLDPYSRQMSVFTFYMIDIFLFLGALGILSVFIFVVLIRFMGQFIFRIVKPKQD